MPEITIIIPIYNEISRLKKSLEDIMSVDLDKEIIVIEDGSSDGSRELLQKLRTEMEFRLVIFPKNQGKGAAVLEGFRLASGNFVTIFDADLEYDPQDLVRLLAEAKRPENKNRAVYGSRFLENKKFNFHYLANFILTSFTNVLFETKITDMETCLKLIPAEALTKLKLSPSRFEIEPSITAQLAKNHILISEIPISYRRRGYGEGKKIRFKDGIKAILALIKEKFNG